MDIDLYFLGAGKPSSGSRPSALKNIANKTRAMDWQLHSFKNHVELKNTYFLGGYNVEDVAKSYPDLNFSIMPNWENSSALNTLLNAPLSGNPSFISYTDTLFRKEFIDELVLEKSEVTIVIDSQWENRFSLRSQQDINNAETIHIGDKKFEFTGLIYLSKNAIAFLKEGMSKENFFDPERRLPDIIDLFKENDIEVTYKDILGDWAEFNHPNDITNFILGTKADTLARLETIVEKSYIGMQECITYGNWKNNPSKAISDIQSKFGETRLAVRSSSNLEDNWNSSNAGSFETILGVNCASKSDVTKAIEDVFESYGETPVDSSQVLVQELLADVVLSGVVFTCTLDSGAPYYRFNFDDTSKSTESITSGMQGDFRTIIISKLNPLKVRSVAPELECVLEAVQELENLLNFDKLDIEFAMDSKGQVHIFQVRPIVVNHENYDIDIEKVGTSIKSDLKRFNELQIASPFILGDKCIFANMPDWNPAEIIGTRPKPLALSLYQNLITNDIWATQRFEYGYRDVRPCPLILSFSGQPFVDVRASFNSFIPASVPEESAKRIINAYLSILSSNPHLHDKIEFDIAFTVWVPEFNKIAEARLIPYGVTKKDIYELEKGLKDITKKALTRLDSDIESVTHLIERFELISYSPVSAIEKIFMLLDDCKQFGTLAFSHAARAGFVASSLLRSFVLEGIISEKRKTEFLLSIETVTGCFEKDKGKSGGLSKEELVKKYGHLRPGTYEISAYAYWEKPDQYLFNSAEKKQNNSSQNFEFTKSELEGITNLLAGLESETSVKDLIKFLIKATQERERVKFEFTRNLSYALDLCLEVGQQFSLNREDLSYLTYDDLEKLKLNASSVDVIKSAIDARKEKYELTKIIELPALIDNPEQFFCFERQSSQPNFVGLGSVVSRVELIDSLSEKPLSGKIVMIPQADPGYDWLFGNDIVGLITQYGGANSHMAIRSAELGLPAAIGVGEKIYDSLRSAKVIELDCLNQILRVVE